MPRKKPGPPPLPLTAAVSLEPYGPPSPVLQRDDSLLDELEQGAIVEADTVPAPAAASPSVEAVIARVRLALYEAGNPPEAADYTSPIPASVTAGDLAVLLSLHVHMAEVISRIDQTLIEYAGERLRDVGG